MSRQTTVKHQARWILALIVLGCSKEAALTDASGARSSNAADAGAAKTPGGQAAADAGANVAPRGNDGGVESVSWPSERLIEGSFSRLSFDGPGTKAFVVALQREAAANESAPSTLTLIAFPSGELCQVGQARDYERAVAPSDADASEVRLPFFAEAPTALRFTNFECEVDAVELPDARRLITSSFTNEPGFVAQTKDSVHFVSPWSGESRLLGKDARPLRGDDLALVAPGTDQDWLWMVSGGVIVALDENLEEVLRAGSDVQEFVHTTFEGRGLVAFRTAEGAAFVLHPEDAQKLTPIAQDACSLAFVATSTGPHLSYFSPCEDRTLVLRDLSSGSTRVISQDVANYRVVGERGGEPLVMYLTGSPEDPVVGSLWLRAGEDDPVFIGDGGHLGLSRLVGEDQLRAVVDYGNRGGTLVVGRAGEALQPIAGHVVYFTSFGVIADFDGNAGTFYELDDDDVLTPRLEGVSDQGVRFDTGSGRALFLTNYDGETGTLNLLQGGKAVALASVRADTYQFAAQLNAVSLFTELDPDTGTADFRLRQFSPDRWIDLASGVAEALEVSWPKSGFLYSVPSGDEAGIWFSDIEISGPAAARPMSP